MKTPIVLIVSIVALSTVVNTAESGELVTYAFSGNVKENPGAPLGLSIAEFDRVYGTFSYEAGELSQHYDPSDGMFNVSVGGTVFDQWGDYHVDLVNVAPGNPAGDSIHAIGAIHDVGDQEIGSIVIAITDSTGAVLSDDFLPADFLRDDFDGWEGTIAENGGDTALFFVQEAYRVVVRLPGDGDFGASAGWFGGTAPDAAVGALFSFLPAPATIGFAADAQTNNLTVFDSDVTLNLSGNTYVVGGGTAPVGLQGISVQGSGRVTVSGPEAILRIPGGAQSADFRLGDAGNGFLGITDGATADIDALFTLGVESGDVGVATVWDAGSNLTLDQPTLTVGKAGFGQIMAGGGGALTLEQPTDLMLADEAGSFGFVFLSETSLNVESLLVGNAGIGHMQVLSGATLTVANDVALAVGAGAAGSMIFVGAGGATLDVGGTVTLGGLAPSNLNVTDTGLARAATFDARALATIQLANGTIEADVVKLAAEATLQGSGIISAGLENDGIITVDGPDSSLSITGSAQNPDILIGRTGSGELRVNGGAAVDIGSQLTIASETDSTGVVLIWDPDSHLTLDHPTLTVGKAGQGNFMIGGGATLTMLQPTDVVVADEPGSFGLAFVSESSWNVQSLVVGNSGSGHMQVISGTDVTVSGDVAVAVNAGADGSTLIVSTEGSTLDVGGTITLGGAATATLGIFDTATVQAASIDAKAGATIQLDNGTLAGGLVKLAPGAMLDGSGIVSADLENNGTVNGIGVESLTLAGYVTGGGSYTTEAMFSGTFSPGNGIATVITEHFALLESGTLRMELGGNDATGLRDQLVATTAYFAGTLDVVLAGAYQPVAGDTYTIFNSGAYAGTPADMNLPEFTDPDLFWGTSSLFENGSLTVIALPPIEDVAQDVAQGTQVIEVLGGMNSERGVTAIFTDVTDAGDFTVEQTNVDEDADLGGFAFDAFDFQLPGETVQLWEMDFSGTFDGPVMLNFHYVEELLAPGVDESALTIFHFDAGEWTELIPLAIDTENNIIIVQSDSFSPFALAVPEPATWLTALLGTLALGAFAARRRRAGWNA